MLFRVLTLGTSVLLTLGILTQLLLPVLYNRRTFPLFRESRLQRAERLRVEAFEKKKAAEREADALRAEIEAGLLDAEMLHDLTGEQPKEQKPWTRSTSTKR